MSDIEDTVRRRAYQLWEDAGRPEGRSDEFWLAAEVEILGKVDNSIAFDPFEPPIEEPPEVAFQHGVPVGMPGERIAEQGVLDDRLDALLPQPVVRSDD
ncbi:MAG TPA: DUF2934 domain-containing protein [Roseiarcus sp.]|nr:DUF2934 domain-containing protein [Roseiarcus sp.]